MPRLITCLPLLLASGLLTGAERDTTDADGGTPVTPQVQAQEQSPLPADGRMTIDSEEITTRSNADPDHPDVLRLDMDAATARARAEQLAVQAARQRIRAAAAGARSRLGFARPQVGARASYELVDGIYNSRANIAMGDDPGDAWLGAVTARQLIYGFGARSAAAALGRSDVALASADRQLTERDIVYQTRLTMGSILHARARLSIAEARRVLRTDELDDAEQLFEAGRIAAIDVRQSEISLIQAKDQLQAEATALDQLFDDLALLLTLPTDRIAVTGRLLRVQDFAVLLQAARDAIDSNSDVAVIDAARLAREATVDSLGAANLPQLHGLGRAGVAGGELDDLEDGWALGLELSWDFDGGARFNRRAQAREEIIALAAQRRLAVDTNSAAIAKLVSAIQALRERISEQERAVALAEQNYDDTRQLYTAGRVTLTRVTEANFSVTQSRFTLIDLIFQENVIAYELMRLAE